MDSLCFLMHNSVLDVSSPQDGEKIFSRCILDPLPPSPTLPHPIPPPPPNPPLLLPLLSPSFCYPGTLLPPLQLSLSLPLSPFFLLLRFPFSSSSWTSYSLYSSPRLPIFSTRCSTST